MKLTPPCRLPRLNRRLARSPGRNVFTGRSQRTTRKADVASKRASAGRHSATDRKAVVGEQGRTWSETKRSKFRDSVGYGRERDGTTSLWPLDCVICLVSLHVEGPCLEGSHLNL
jgi:hypothetical protein